MNQYSRRDTVFLVCAGIFLLCIGALPRASNAIIQIQHQILSLRDSGVGKIQATFVDLQTLVHLQVGKDKRISALEERNRTLYAQVTNQQQELYELRARTSTVSGALTKSIDATSSGVISFSQGEWIIIPSNTERYSPGQIIVLDGVYLGTIGSEDTRVARIELLTGRSTGLLVSHVLSGARGILRTESDRTRVQFLEKVPNLRVGDIVASVPDGTYSRVGYPVARVSATDDNVQSGGTTATVESIATPAIGRQVSVITMGTPL